MPVMFKAITPRAFDSEVFRREVVDRGEKAEAGILRDYQKTVETWEHKVKFRARLIINPNGGVSITVDTDDEIYTFVHEGTEPHVIRPKKAKVLRFQGTYTAKTVPGVIQSQPGGASGEFSYANVVMHPGTKAREFSKVIFAKWRPYFEREMQRALDEAARKSGHSI